MPLRVLFANTITGGKVGQVPNQITVLYQLFKKEGQTVLATSAVINKPLRYLDVVSYIIRKRNKYDILHIDIYSGPNFYITSVASLLGKLLGKKMVMVLHGGNIPEWYKTNKKWMHKVMDRAHALVTPSDFLAEWLLSIGYQAVVIPNVIENFDSYPFRIRNKIKPNFFWMRKFHPIWNPDMAVLVLKKILGKYPDAKLVLAGGDEGYQSVTKELVRKLDVQNNVEFTGFLKMNKKVQYADQADIFLHTNRIDNMPVSVIEACAMGLVIIATKVGGIPYLLKNEENALLVDDNSVEQMAEAINRLLLDPELCGKLSENGRKLALKSSWLEVKKQWESLYTNL
ncbi:MAG: glycosyltransferase family 4 protein [Bacteroidota bacterium]|nr:glycosyltransferase family 4 protein [Bacteroidota bacterium]